VLRTGAADEETSVMMRCGPFGLGGEGACSHSHADMLSPVIHWHGRPIIVDTGTFAYYTDKTVREEARSTASHNTFAPRGVEQARKYPTWDWDNIPDSHVQWFECDNERTVISARFGSPQGFVHCRTIALETKPVSIRIEDRITVAQHLIGTPLEWMAHFAPGITLREISDSTLHICCEGVAIARIVHEEFDTRAILETWHSPLYGVKLPAWRLQLVTEGECVQVRVMILPLE